METQTREPSRTPSKAPALALPFGVVGLAAGWLSYGLLTIPFIDVLPRWAPLANRLFMVAPAAALLGASIGAVLSRGTAARARRGATLLLALVVAGGIVTWATMTWPMIWERQLGTVVFHGGLHALVFVPICALVIAAVRRAERARQGSIVAGADRRAVWMILATVLAVSTVRGPSSAVALDGPLTLAQEIILLPRSGMAIAAAAGLVVLALLLADTFAMIRVTRAANAVFEQCDPPSASDAGMVPSLDLGLGDDMHARVDRAPSPYRRPRRPVALLLGSATAARAVLARALLRGAFGLAITTAVLAEHRWAQTPAALLAFLEARCQRKTYDCKGKIDWFGYCHRSRTACKGLEQSRPRPADP